MQSAMDALFLSKINTISCWVFPLSTPSQLGPRRFSLQRQKCRPCKYLSRSFSALKCSHTEWGHVEEEILKFMESSKNPVSFPTKQELLDAGRTDLVEAVISQGGWLAAGWDLDCTDYIQEPEGSPPVISGDFHEEYHEAVTKTPFMQQPIDVSAVEVSEAFESKHKEEDTGITGILNRIEKERSRFLSDAAAARWEDIVESADNDRRGFLVDSNEPETLTVNVDTEDSDDLVKNTAQDRFEMIGFREKILDKNGWEIADLINSQGLQAERKKSFSQEKQSISTGYQDFRTENFIEDNNSVNRQNEMIINVNPAYDKDAELGYSKDTPDAVTSRIQQLEAQLSSTMGLLRSGDDIIGAAEILQHQFSLDWLDEKDPFKHVQITSDALEFQETEIMKLRDKLRSTRAKLTALEGKMTMELKELRNTIADKQKMLADAQRILSVMRTARIVWPHSASEVYVAGSFDGWSGRRKMDKSNTGVFVLCLLLYPGRYEIKFIVDGNWKVDQQRPVVYNSGHENNLLMVN